jgi:cytoplasmic iron level regulating protein YaaA (DUF328/UPF0246 family)
MLVVVSPAKKLNMEMAEMGKVAAGTVVASAPQFSDNAHELAGVARGLTIAELQKLMGLSASLAQLNADRFAAFGQQATKPAVLAFAGDTYQGLEAASLDEHEMAWAQNHLRILSGLYGVLRPLDAIEPYRLEMGSRLHTARGTSLYAYWGKQLAQTLNEQAVATGADVLVNCASQEYFGAVDQNSLNPRVITPVFKELKDGKDKIVSFFAKKARGAMARYMIQHRITNPDALKDFDAGGYVFQPEKSDAQNFVFLREYPNPA